MGAGFRGHLVEFGRNILELSVYYLMLNKCKNLKDMKESRRNGVKTGCGTQSGYELKVKEPFQSIFRVIMIFFLSVVDSNTCDRIRTIRPRTTCNNARNIDLRYLKGY